MHRLRPAKSVRSVQVRWPWWPLDWIITTHPFTWRKCLICMKKPGDSLLDSDCLSYRGRVAVRRSVARFSGTCHNCYCVLLSTQLWVCPTWTFFSCGFTRTCYHGMGRPQVEVGSDGFRTLGDSWEYINKKLRTADKRWCSAFWDPDEE